MLSAESTVIKLVGKNFQKRIFSKAVRNFSLFVQHKSHISSNNISLLKIKYRKMYKFAIFA
ncbi:conserved hypothetical protein [delta proteobacterium NaphS2]|nr:conserved hypothetical protein [delta proteobacterium NaphS2]